MKLTFSLKIIVIFLLTYINNTQAINLNGKAIIKNCTSAFATHLFYSIAHNAGHILIPTALLALGCETTAGSRNKVDIQFRGIQYQPFKIAHPRFANYWFDKLDIIGSVALSIAAIYGAYKIHNMLIEKNENTHDGTIDESLPLVNSKQPIGLHLATLLHIAENLVCIYKG